MRRVRHVDTTTTPITLHPFTLDDAERMLSGEVDPHDGWEGAYAFTDEPELLREYVRAVRENGDPAPFGPYLVRRGARRRDHRGSEPVRPARAPKAPSSSRSGSCRRCAAQGLSLHTVARGRRARPVSGRPRGPGRAEVANLPARRALEEPGSPRSPATGDTITYEMRL